MKRAVILAGGKQYLVTEGQELEIDKLADPKAKTLAALLVINDDQISIGQPTLDGTTIDIEVIEPEILGDKVTAIRYKAKKRVHKLRGHRQKLSKIKITKISS